MTHTKKATQFWEGRGGGKKKRKTFYNQSCDLKD